jgi:hypothetical protein
MQKDGEDYNPLRITEIHAFIYEPIYASTRTKINAGDCFLIDSTLIHVEQMVEPENHNLGTLKCKELWDIYIFLEQFTKYLLITAAGQIMVSNYLA